MDIEIKKVNSFTSIVMPPDDATIDTDFNINLMSPHINTLDVYFYEEDKDGINKKSEWRIDMELNDNSVFRIILPKEMSESRVTAFVQPLLTLKNQSRKDLH